MRRTILIISLFISATYSVGLSDISAEDNIGHAIEVGYIPPYLIDCGYRFIYTATPFVDVGFDLRLLFFPIYPLPLGATIGTNIEFNFSREENVTLEPSFHFGTGICGSFFSLEDISYYFQSSFCLNFRSPHHTYTPFIEGGTILGGWYPYMHIIIQGGVKF
ncbi:MAG: hypothetical protein DRH49_04000 [Candidatus Coatesbacteria bacterium]|nr:MAG: hypothetical protein DRH49_04000 [Candidatus Coatesbacteria bacterium]